MPIHHSSMYQGSRYRESMYDDSRYATSADGYANHDDDRVEMPTTTQTLNRLASDSLNHSVSRRSSSRIWLQPPSGNLSALLDAIAWIVGAGLLRLNVERWLMMQGTVSAWFCGIAVLIAPALILIHLSTRCPNHRGVIIYRSLLLMFGLLLGGRL